MATRACGRAFGPCFWHIYFCISPWSARLYKFPEARKYGKNTKQVQRQGLTKMQEKYRKNTRKTSCLDTRARQIGTRPRALDTRGPGMIVKYTSKCRKPFLPRHSGKVDTDMMGGLRPSPQRGRAPSAPAPFVVMVLYLPYLRVWICIFLCICGRQVDLWPSQRHFL